MKRRRKSFGRDLGLGRPWEAEGVFIGRDQGVRLECEHPDFLVEMGPEAGMIKGIFVAKTLALRYSVS